MTLKPSNETYSKKEIQERFEAALRGSRLVGHRPLKDIPKRNGESRAAIPKRRPKKAK